MVDPDGTPPHHAGIRASVVQDHPAPTSGADAACPTNNLTRPTASQTKREEGLDPSRLRVVFRRAT